MTQESKTQESRTQETPTPAPDAAELPTAALAQVVGGFDEFDSRRTT